MTGSLLRWNFKCFGLLILSIASLTLLPGNCLAAAENIESSFRYPGAFRILKASIQSLKKCDPETRESALALLDCNVDSTLAKVNQCRLDIRTARKALFALTFYQKTLPRSELDQESGEFVDPSANAKSVSSLIEEARDLLQKFNIPLPRSGEFWRPPPLEVRQTKPISQNLEHQKPAASGFLVIPPGC